MMVFWDKKFSQEEQQCRWKPSKDFFFNNQVNFDSNY